MAEQQFIDSEGYPIPNTEPPAPCPFCGSSEHVYVTGHEYDNCAFYTPGCGQCGSEGPVGSSWTDAARQWNARGVARPLESVA